MSEKSATQAPGRLFCFGLGYSALALARRLLANGEWSVAGTVRTAGAAAALEAEGIKSFVFDGESPMRQAEKALEATTHLLISIPPGDAGDPVLVHHAGDLAGLKGLEWAGYLSTTGVYGDTVGRTVDEDAPLNPTSDRGRRRAAAEAAWLALHRESGLPAHLFRLAGIYGPGRSVLDKVRAGRALRIDKPGHLFGRIHVDDIAQTLAASMRNPRPGRVYNVTDDAPAAPADVAVYACELLGMAPPPLVSFDAAAKDMSPMARTFWRDNRRVDNSRIKRELGVTLGHPDYRSGLRAVLAAEEAGKAAK